MTVPEVVFVLGPPGAGKGTQCSKISERYGYIHLSAGDLLRAERASGSVNGDLIQEYITNGQIIPVAITIKLLEAAIVSSGASKVLIDGFPRNKENLEGWETEMTNTGKIKTKFMLFFECSEDECLARAMGRDQGRADDNVESFKKRINTYLDSTMAVVEEFRGRGALRVINANPGPDIVFEETSKLFQGELSPDLAAAVTQDVAPLPPLPTLPPLPAVSESVITEQQPVVTEQQPVVTEQQPVVTEQGSLMIDIPLDAHSDTDPGLFSYCTLL